ncbi:hypothetical protein AVEN_133305-1 [Araneus ventricosus]|uniref:Uncharacterized protein n=1 Tax=Araneus ventricosus TaxID=182803 RepID=A0A4Y2DLZ7_ARAVE|nr:hypothetical protein AVEN_133305-1 [Araneus ventricosus]
MTALNIIDDAYVILGEQSKIQFPYTRPVESIKGESFRVIAYNAFPTTRKETKTATFLIPSGMYQNAKDLFKEFKFISLRLSADSRVGLHVPQHTVVTFGEKLKDLLGFSRQTFDHGDYKSEYVLELRAGITEVYVYCDIEKKYINALTFCLVFRAKNNHGEARHRLQPEHCIAHYQNQIGNANPYFSSDFPIQRGYGFFSSLRRYALPLMMQAGKYLGKRLLTSDRNIVEDVSQGKSFRHAARDQIRQSGREITADILHNLRGGGGVKRKKSKQSHQTKRKKLSRTDVFSDL